MMSNTVLVTNLDSDMDVSKLCDLFKRFGKITSAHIDFDKNFDSLCTGSVSFDNATSAIIAKAEIPKYCKMDAKMCIKSNDNYKVFVKNIPATWDECDLSSIFSNCGKIRESQINCNDDGESNCYGYVSFLKSSSAKKAIEDMNHMEVEGKYLIVEKYLNKSTRDTLKYTSLDFAKTELAKSVQYNNLHVKNIPKEMDDDGLRKLFDKFGSITSVKIMRNEDNTSKCFGFVSFDSEVAANLALKHMNGYSLKYKKLEVNFNQRKEERERYFLMKNRTKAMPENTVQKVRKPGNNMPLKKQLYLGNNTLEKRNQSSIFDYNRKY